MRRLLRPVLALALCTLATPSFAASFRFIEVPADAEGSAMTGGLWYPCAEPAGTVRLGPYVLPVAKDCPFSGEKHPLVVVSHGRGGNFLGHHDTAEAMADAGFIVAAINHPGDTRSDMSRATELSVYVSRPADIKRLVDYMAGPSPAAPFVDPSRIGLFGFSRGGYTGLAVIGANADWANALSYCGDSQGRGCKQIRNKDFLGQSRTTRGSRPPSSPIRLLSSSPPKPWRRSRYRCSSGSRSWAAMACSCAIPPHSTRTWRRRTNIISCRTPDTSPSSSARPKWRKPRLRSAPTEAASTARPFTRNSTPRR